MNLESLGRLFGLGSKVVVSMLAFYSDDPRANPVEIYSFFCKMLFVKNKKRPGLAYLRNVAVIGSNEVTFQKVCK